MAWTSPATAVTGDVIPAAFWNTNGRDNLLAIGGSDGNTHTGNWLPEADGTRDIGASATRWRDAYFSRLARVGSRVELAHITTPASPAAGYVAIYAKSDDLIYKLNSSGSEVPVGGGGDEVVTYLYGRSF